MGLIFLVGCGEEEKVEPPKAPIPPSSPESSAPSEEAGEEGAQEEGSSTESAEEPKGKEEKEPSDEAKSSPKEVEGEKAAQEETENQGEADAPNLKGEAGATEKEGNEKEGSDKPVTGKKAEVEAEASSEMEGDGDAGNELGTMSSLKDCTEALESLVNNAKTLGLQEPDDMEKEEFLVQCSEWPKKSARCLASSQAPNEILECMKPIAKHELEKSRERAIEEGDDLERILNERIKRRK